MMEGGMTQGNIFSCWHFCFFYRGQRLHTKCLQHNHREASKLIINVYIRATQYGCIIKQKHVRMCAAFELVEKGLKVGWSGPGGICVGLYMSWY